MRSSTTKVIVGMALGIAMTIAVTPATAHVSRNFAHLFNRHVMPRLAALPDCPVNQAIAGFEENGNPICEMTDVYSGHRDQIFNLAPGVNEQVADLGLPNGKFLILAKAVVQNTANSEVLCKLVADGDTDFAYAYMGPNTPREEVSLMVTHEFPNGGNALFQCQSANSGTGVYQVKISAIRVGYTANGAL